MFLKVGLWNHLYVRINTPVSLLGILSNSFFPNRKHLEGHAKTKAIMGGAMICFEFFSVPDSSRFRRGDRQAFLLPVSCSDVREKDRGVLTNSTSAPGLLGLIWSWAEAKLFFKEVRLEQPEGHYRCGVSDPSLFYWVSGREATIDGDVSRESLDTITNGISLAGGPKCARPCWLFILRCVVQKRCTYFHLAFWCWYSQEEERKLRKKNIDTKERYRGSGDWRVKCFLWEYRYMICH